MESVVLARTKLFLKNAIFRSGTDLPQSSVCAQTFLFKESASGLYYYLKWKRSHVSPLPPRQSSATAGAASLSDGIGDDDRDKTEV